MAPERGHLTRRLSGATTRTPMDSQPPLSPGTAAPSLRRPAATVAQRIRETPVRHLHGAPGGGGPYWFDKPFFGVPASDGVLTPNEFFERHHWPAVDFFTGLAYIVFVYWAMGFAAYIALF